MTESDGSSTTFTNKHKSMNRKDTECHHLEVQCDRWNRSEIKQTGHMTYHVTFDTARVTNVVNVNKSFTSMDVSTKVLSIHNEYLLMAMWQWVNALKFWIWI